MVGDKTPPEDTWKVRAELGQLYEAVLVEESFRKGHTVQAAKTSRLMFFSFSFFFKSLLYFVAMNL